MRSCSLFTAPSGAHICLKCAFVVTLPVGYSGSLSTANQTCNKDKGYCTKLSVHIFQVLPHAKIGCTPVRLTWEDHLSSLFHSEEFDELAPNITGLPVPVCCTFNELESTLWLSDLVFSGLSDALGPSDIGNLFTVLISIPPHHVIEITG